jgi:hypothetical protein
MMGYSGIEIQLSRYWYNQEVSQVGVTSTAEMGVAESYNGRIIVPVSGTVLIYVFVVCAIDIMRSAELSNWKMPTVSAELKATISQALTDQSKPSLPLLSWSHYERLMRVRNRGSLELVYAGSRKTNVVVSYTRP